MTERVVKKKNVQAKTRLKLYSSFILILFFFFYSSSYVLLVGLAMLGRSADEGLDKTAL